MSKKPKISTKTSMSLMRGHECSVASKAPKQKNATKKETG